MTRQHHLRIAATSGLLGLLLACSKQPDVTVREAKSASQANVVIPIAAPSVESRTIRVSATPETLAVNATAAPWRDVLASVAFAADVVVIAHQAPKDLLTLDIGPLPTDMALRALAGTLDHRVSRGTDGRWRLEVGEATPQRRSTVQAPQQDVSAGSSIVVVSESYGKGSAGQIGVMFDSDLHHLPQQGLVVNGSKPVLPDANSDRAVTVLEESFKGGFSQRHPSNQPPEAASSNMPFGRP